MVSVWVQSVYNSLRIGLCIFCVRVEGESLSGLPHANSTVGLQRSFWPEYFTAGGGCEMLLQCSFRSVVHVPQVP